MTQLNIRFVGFLGNSKAGSRLYAIILVLAFFEIFGKTGTFIFSLILYYIIIVALLLVFAVKFPPSRKRMYEIFGEDFILKYMGNPGSVNLRLVTSAAFGAGVLGLVNEGQNRGYLPSDQDKADLFKKTQEIAEQPPEGLAALTGAGKKFIDDIFEQVGN